MVITRKSTSLFIEIQNDILGNEDLSQILLKAKVLSYKLKNQEFKDWVENELNGYVNTKLPEYRVVSTIAQGDFGNRFEIWKNIEIPLYNIDEELHHNFNEIRIIQGIKELESILNSIDRSGEDFVKNVIPIDLIALLNSSVFDSHKCLRAWCILSKGNITQIIATTRNRLLEFILELANKYPEIKEIKPDSDFNKEIPNEQIKQVFNISILGWKNQVIDSSSQTIQGDKMSVFDQRGQNVNTQYNAAGDINFNSVQNSSEFVAELRKLKDEFLRIAKEEAIDAEIVTDTEYQLTKAIQQAEKPAPNKENILTHLENAKQLVDGVDAAIKVGGWVTVAIELAHKIFG